MTNRLDDGLSIAAMMAQSHCEVFATGDHACVFGGSPLATATGTTIAQNLTGEGIVQTSINRCVQQDDGLSTIQNRIGGCVDDMHSKGLFKGVRLGSGITSANMVAHSMDSDYSWCRQTQESLGWFRCSGVTEVFALFENKLKQAVTDSKA